MILSALLFSEPSFSYYYVGTKRSYFRRLHSRSIVLSERSPLTAAAQLRVCVRAYSCVCAAAAAPKKGGARQKPAAQPSNLVRRFKANVSYHDEAVATLADHYKTVRLEGTLASTPQKPQGCPAAESARPAEVQGSPELRQGRLGH